MTKASGTAAASFVAFALALQLGTFGCKDRDCNAGDKLSMRVQAYCGKLAFDVKTAAQEFADNAPKLDAADPDARRRTEELLQRRSIGTNKDLRREALLDLEMRFDFCIQARQIDDSQLTTLQVRVDGIIGDLGSVLATGELPTSQVTVKGLTDLAALAEQINALPLVN